MGKTLYTKKELAERWGISISTLDRRIKERVITPTNTTGQPRFHIDDILKAEGTDNSKMSAFERRRLLMEIEQLKCEKREIEQRETDLRKVLNKAISDVFPFITGSEPSC